MCKCSQQGVNVKGAHQEMRSEEKLSECPARVCVSSLCRCDHQAGISQSQEQQWTLGVNKSSDFCNQH